MIDKEKLDKSAPWYEHCHKLDSLFAYDDDVRVGEYDDETKTVKVFVSGVDKALALEKIIKPEVEFSGVTLKVVVVPANDDEPTVEDTLRYAFNGNPLFTGTAVVEMYGGDATYAVFEPTVVQYWNDNIGSCFGIETKTVEDVARDVLDVDAFICTDFRELSEE